MKVLAFIISHVLWAPCLALLFSCIISDNIHLDGGDAEVDGSENHFDSGGTDIDSGEPNCDGSLVSEISTSFCAQALSLATDSPDVISCMASSECKSFIPTLTCGFSEVKCCVVYINENGESEYVARIDAIQAQYCTHNCRFGVQNSCDGDAGSHGCSQNGRCQ